MEFYGIAEVGAELQCAILLSPVLLNPMLIQCFDFNFL